MSKQQLQLWSEYLRDTMKARGYFSAAELARVSNISESLLSRYLRGATLPDVPTLRRLAKPLQISVLDLLVVSGHLSPEEAEMQRMPEPPRQLTFEEMLDRIEELTQSDKDVFRALYRGLRLEKEDKEKASNRSRQ